MRNIIYKVFGLSMLVIFSLTSCNSNNSSGKSEHKAEGTVAPSMSEEKSKGKGNRTGQLPAKTFRITDNSVNGVKAGLSINSLQHLLVRAKIKVGDEILNVYRIRDDKGGPMGYALPRIGNTDLVGEITIDSKKILTSHGIRVGDTFGRFKETVVDFSFNGEEIGGNYYLEKDNLSYRLDAINSNQKVDLTEISTEAKIIEIIILDRG